MWKPYNLSRQVALICMYLHLTPEYIYESMTMEELNSLYTEAICIKNEENGWDEGRKESKEIERKSRNEFMKLYGLDIVEKEEKKLLNKDVVPIEIIV